MKLRPASSVRIAAERVVYRATAGRQIAASERSSGYGDQVELPAYVADVKNIREEKRLVLDNRSAHAPAIVVVRAACHRVGRAVEKAARGQRAHTVVLVSRAMEAVRTGLQYHIRHRASGASKLSRVVAGTNVHGLDGFRGRDVDLQQAGALVITHALDHQLVELARLAVHFCGKAVLGVEEFGVVAVGPHGSWS